MINKKGFTLLEILVIIVVLVIIFLASIPIVKMIIENSRFGGFENSVYSAFDAIDNYIAAKNFIQVPEDGMDIAILDESILKNNNFDEGLFVMENNKPRLVYIKQGNYCAKGTKAKLLTTDKGCGALDRTPPTKANVFVKNIIGKTIYLVAAGYDEDSEIAKYEISIDGKEYYANSNPKNNVFKIELNDSNEHSVKIRVKNEADMFLESKVKKIKLKNTTNINVYESDLKEFVASSKKINFEKDKDVKYSYSTDLETWSVITPDDYIDPKSETKVNNDILIDENQTIYIKCETKNGVYYNTLNIENVDNVLNGSYPELLDGMIPVVYEDGKWVIANKNKIYWDYENRIWANVVFVRKARNEEDLKSKNRGYYMSNEAIGTEIYAEDILAYYVWIPKYSYKIWNLYGKNPLEKEIDIEFGTKKKTGDTEGEFVTHNAFNYKKEKGFWVSKYESSADIDSNCYQAGICNKENINIYSVNERKFEVVPNPKEPRKVEEVVKKVDSIKNISISNASINSENISKKFNIYGLNTSANSHLITNLEWGAIAYLSNSKYGSGVESTTGNVTGVYGMDKGGEYVMASYNKDTGLNKDDNSGFTPAGKNNWPKKFIDIYKSISIKSYILGDAIMETNEWNNNENVFINGEYPFLIRGTKNIYDYVNSSGDAKKNVSFRVAIVK